jgi:hypothetical protein
MVSLTIGGSPHLVVIGGKEGVADEKSLNTVYKLNVQDCLKLIKKKKGDEEVITKGWEQCAPMNEARCMFAATVVNNRYIYVFGGTREAVQF